jgi:hypothetical protein
MKCASCGNKISMAKFITNVVSINWGFFKENENRMHLQPVEILNDKIVNKYYNIRLYKIWLEKDGVRAFEKAHDWMNDGVVSQVQKAFTEGIRDHVEFRWAQNLARLNKLKVEINEFGMAVLTVYAGTGDQFTRGLNLAKEYPNCEDMWAPGNWKFNVDTMTLDLELDRFPDNPSQIPVWRYLWVDPK